MLDNTKIESIIEWLKLYPHLLKDNDTENLYIAERETYGTMDRPWERADLTRFLINTVGVKRAIGNMTTIPSYWLDNDTEIQGKIIIPDNVHTIGRFAFTESNLTQIDLNQVEVIRTRAFEGCQLESITIPNTMAQIYKRVFLNNPLKEVIFERDCDTELDSTCFENCPIKIIRCSEEIKNRLPDYLQEKVELW